MIAHEPCIIRNTPKADPQHAHWTASIAKIVEWFHTWMATDEERQGLVILSAFTQAEESVHLRALETGDVFLMYTDGITEAKSAGGELFGPERLASTLASVASRPVLEIRDHVLAEAQRFMKTQADDMTLIVLRYSGAPV